MIGVNYKVDYYIRSLPEAEPRFTSDFVFEKKLQEKLFYPERAQKIVEQCSAGSKRDTTSKTDRPNRYIG